MGSPKYSPYLAPHESPPALLFSLAFLCFGSIFGGYLFKDIFVGPGSDFFSQAVVLLPVHSFLIEAEFIPLLYKLFPFILCLLGISLPFFFYHRTLPLHIGLPFKNLYLLLLNK